MSMNEEEGSVRSRKSACSQLTMSYKVNAEGEGVEAQQRKTACAWAQREQAMKGARERISAGVVAQSREGNGMDAFWRVLSVIERGPDSQKEEKRVRDRVVATVEER